MKQLTIGTPLSPSATKVMLLGSGELGKEVLIALQRDDDFLAQFAAAEQHDAGSGGTERGSDSDWVHLSNLDLGELLSWNAGQMRIGQETVNSVYAFSALKPPSKIIHLSVRYPGHSNHRERDHD